MTKRNCIIVFLLIFMPTVAWAVPSNLHPVPISGTQVDLTWMGQTGEIYKVWQSTGNGAWDNIYTFSQPGADSYSVTTGIEPYVNYYFAITTSAVVYYQTDSKPGINATYEQVAYPPNAHEHAYYDKNTNICGDCHSTHVADGAKLLVMPTANELCISCHDGTSSKYIVTDGVVDGGTAGQLTTSAGPMGPILGVQASTYPESIHTIGTVVSEAPGGNPGGTGEEWTEALGCLSCHDAHGPFNYRMLSVSTPDNVNAKVYGYAVTDKASGQEVSSYIYGMSEFCMGCHKDYYAGTGAGSIPATGTYSSNGTYMHPVGVAPADYSTGPLTTTLPLEGGAKDNTDKIMCLTCHKAHGSTTINDAVESGTPFDGLTAMRNYLLRTDYLGVCQDCHKK